MKQSVQQRFAELCDAQYERPFSSLEQHEFALLSAIVTHSDRRLHDPNFLSSGREWASCNRITKIEERYANLKRKVRDAKV